MKNMLLPALVIGSFLLLGPYISQASDSAGPVLYQQSITHDGEGGILSLPSFVLAEEVMNEIYVIDSRSRIIIYTSDLYPLYTLTGRDGIEAPQGLTIDDHGNVYVAQAPSKGNQRARISVFDPCLNWNRDIYLEGFEGSDSFIPYRLTRDMKGNLYVASAQFPGILILDDKDRLVEILSPEEDGKKVKLNNVTIDRKGNIYLVSEDKSRIFVYNKERKFLFKFGEKGGSSGKLSRPKAVAVDEKNGRIYVADYMRHTVTVYDMAGNYIFEFGGMGWSDGWLQHPMDIEVDSNGTVIIADLFNHRVQLFSPGITINQ